jgi:ADP-ribosyl-[dinitrogen reductase] hydrolase
VADPGGFPPKPFPNTFWIEPGRILAGEYPGATTRAATQRRLKALIAAGITYFIDLTEAGELPPYDVLLPTTRASDGRYVVYARKSIRDHGLPARPEVMAEIIEYLDRALEAGHQIYVHCRAGIGRTNLALGCWMRSQGRSGPEAIERLNRLWQANARAASWPRVPEANQEQYILAWAAPGGRRGGDAGDRGRYAGALLGLACGDAMGATLQLRKPGEFVPLADMIGGGHWQLPPGAWTDDTAMTLCLAESLLQRQGFDAADQMQRYLQWQRDGYMSSTGQCIGITAGVSKALAASQWSRNPFCGSHDPQMRDPQALCRVGAVVLYCESNPAQAFAWAAEAARLTHQSPGILDACRYYAGLLLAALRGTPRNQLLAVARELLAQHHSKPMKRELTELMSHDSFPREAADDSGEAVATLTSVLWALGISHNYRDGLLRLVNLGGNSDVNGALYGQLAGALYGAESIPKSWVDKLAQREMIGALGDQLLAAALSATD